MGGKLTKHTYALMVDEDIQWLLDNTQEDTLERQHIVTILKWSKEAIYTLEGGSEENNE